MKIDIAKEDLWWLRNALEVAINHMEGCRFPSVYSKTPHVARKTYKKLSRAMPGWAYDPNLFPEKPI